MGNIEYRTLPKHIAVKVSPNRWAIATLFGQWAEAEWKSPEYVITSDRMTQSQCASALSLLQQKEKKSEVSQNISSSTGL